jgi:predicted nucleic acid-binding protein
VTAFFDTNLLVYLFDSASPEKQGRAREVFSERAQRDEVLLSTQVLQEFYVTVTRKLAAPLSADEAERLVRDFAVFPVVSTDAPLVVAAIALSRRHRAAHRGPAARPDPGGRPHRQSVPRGRGLRE